jgi:ArsR family transcriptional regulator
MEHICGIGGIDASYAEKRRALLPDERTLTKLSDFFKIFADETRQKILFSLDSGPLCVCEISEILGMSNSAVSHQLKILRHSDLVRTERKGKNIYYTLADSHVKDIIEKALEHIKEVHLR